MSKNQVLTRKDFSSDQAVRWCPGCGDYAILAQTQKVFPEITTKKEDVVFISGIGREKSCDTKAAWRAENPDPMSALPELADARLSAIRRPI